MLLLIFGAGASFDAVPAYAPQERNHEARLPLSDHLFDLRYADHLSYFRRASPIIPLLRDVPESVEEVLEGLQAEAGTYPERLRQLMAVRYYLHLMISGLDRQWFEASRGVTNYLAVLDEVRRLVPAEVPVCIVTFNYDRMLDWALRDLDQPVAGLASYTSGRFRLFKMHGSVHWGREIESMPDPGDKGSWELVQHVIACAPDVKPSTRYRVNEDRPMVQDGPNPLVPAIAIPLRRKQDFELPAEHRAELERMLPEVTELVSVGWRGADAPFMRLLAGKATRPIRGIVVADTNADATVNAFLAAGLNIRLEGFLGGFTSFVRRRGITTFLSASAVSPR
jgi:hypothetical protein